MLDGGHEVNEVWFDNVEVPADNLVGEENKGWTYAKHLLAHERTNIADVNRAKRELERVKRIAKAEGVYEDGRFRDEIAKLEVDIVALEMMVLRVLSAEKSGKAALDVAGLLKIRGSEIQQRYTELMMLAAGPVRRALRARRRWKPAGRATRSARRTARRWPRPTSTCARRRSTVGPTRSSATSSPPPCSGAEHGLRFFRRPGIAARRGAPLGRQGLLASSAATASPRPAARTREVYAELAELGLTGLAVPEAHGGMGFGAIEAMVVCEELGRGLVNAPYAQGALVAPVLLSAAPAEVQAQWLPKIADASALVVLAHQERAARYRLNHVTTQGDEVRQRLDADGREEHRAGRRRGRCLRRAGAHRRRRR